MQEKRRILLYHAVAILTVAIWGTTFVSTKVLIKNGLAPAEIMLLRFILAYACILAVSHKRLWAASLKDELLLFAAGLSGGSLYFIAENSALGITQASNVSLLICTTPVFTSILSGLLKMEPLRKRLFTGSLLALSGVALVVFNGSVVLKISPLGDALTLVAAMLWALYCVILKCLDNNYSTMFVTRKIFIYGILSLLALSVFFPLHIDTSLLLRPAVYLNLLFLGIIASMICYVMWNATMKVLGPAKTANYIYLTPPVTLVASSIFLNETITAISIAGMCLIICGVYIAEK